MARKFEEFAKAHAHFSVDEYHGAKIAWLELESDLKLERAAVWREASEIAHNEKNGDNRVIEERILALIPSTDASALDKLLAEARPTREELAKILFELDNKPGDAEWPEDWAVQPYCRWALRDSEKMLTRLAALRAAPRDSGKAASQPTGTPEERER
jgi:hypothetical protein